MALVTHPVNVVYKNKSAILKPLTLDRPTSLLTGVEINLPQLSVTICFGELNELTARLCGNAPIVSEGLYGK